MRRIIFLLVGFTAFYAFSGNAYAYLWNYTVSGTIEDLENNKEFSVSGSMTIDDTLRLWEGQTDSPAPPAPPVLGNAQYSYFIPGYSLAISELLNPGNTYSFAGSAGSFYIERTSSQISDIEWFLENGSGDWDEWYGTGFEWYHEDGTPYDLFNELGELAPIIRLIWLQSGGDPVFGENLNTDIMLQRAAPVPEPTTMLLLGCGLLGLAGIRMKSKYVQ